MVDLEEAGRPAARDDAPTVIAPLDLPADGRGDVVGQRLRGVTIDAPDALRVALGALDGRGADVEHLARGVLPAAPAALADRQRDLMTRPAAVADASEDRVAQRLHDVVVGELLAGVVFE